MRPKSLPAAPRAAPLVLDRVTSPRKDLDGPAASKITDCTPSLGAWFDLVFVSYACSGDGLRP